MKATIYANYGALFHEEEVCYTSLPVADVYEELTVNLPSIDDQEWFFDDDHGLCIFIDGYLACFDDLLDSFRGRPVLHWFLDHGNGGQRFVELCEV